MTITFLPSGSIDLALLNPEVFFNHRVELVIESTLVLDTFLYIFKHSKKFIFFSGDNKSEVFAFIMCNREMIVR